MTILVIIIFLALIAAFVVRVWSGQGRLAARDRWALLTGFVTAATAFAIVSLPLDVLVIPEIAWLIGVGLLAGGVAGAVLRWPDLSWYAGTNPLARAVGVIATLCFGALLIGVAVV